MNTLSTGYNSNAPYSRVWTIYANGVAVWSQVKMFAPAEVKQLIEDFRKVAA